MIDSNIGKMLLSYRWQAPIALTIILLKRRLFSPPPYQKTIQLTYRLQRFLARSRQIADGIFHHKNSIQNSIGDVLKTARYH